MKILAYACSGRPNALWSSAQYNSALSKNRAECDIPLVSKADADFVITEKDERIAALEAGISDLVKIARQHVPSIPPDGPTSTEHQAAYEATGFAFVEIRNRARALIGGGNAE